MAFVWFVCGSQHREAVAVSQGVHFLRCCTFAEEVSKITVHTNIICIIKLAKQRRRVKAIHLLSFVRGHRKESTERSKTLAACSETVLGGGRKPAMNAFCYS